MVIASIEAATHRRRMRDDTYLNVNWWLMACCNLNGTVYSKVYGVYVKNRWLEQDFLSSLRRCEVHTHLRAHEWSCSPRQPLLILVSRNFFFTDELEQSYLSLILGWITNINVKDYFVPRIIVFNLSSFLELGIQGCQPWGPPREGYLETVELGFELLGVFLPFVSFGHRCKNLN